MGAEGDLGARTMNKHEKQVRAIAREMNRAHHITMRQCMEAARSWVKERDALFSPQGLKEAAKRGMGRG